MHHVFSLIAAVAVATTPPAPTPDALQPLGKWAVDYGETSCVASRQFGDAQKPTLMAIRPSLNDTTVKIMIALPHGLPDAAHFPVTISGVKTTGLRFYSRETKRRIIWIDFERTVFDRISGQKSVNIQGQNLRLEFSLAGAAGAVRAMRVCNADLRKHWNADEAGQALVATKAMPLVRPEKLISSSDYPSQAIRESRGGRTRVSLLIDELGVTRDCVVEEHSGVATIDAQTCFMVLKRAKFDPARDQARKPVKSALSYAFAWKMG